MAKGIDKSELQLSMPTFTYAGQKYRFVAEIFSNHNYEPNSGYLLDNGHIELFQYTNELNKLCLTGKLIYVDIIGIVSNYIDLPIVNCVIGFNQVQQEHDGVFTAENSNFDQNSATSFVHNFIINKIEIIGREGSAMKYMFHLISANWYKTIATLDYSNYDQDPQSIGQIFSECFSLANLNIETSVEQGSTNSQLESLFPTKINFATSGNQNIMAITDYLFTRCYYYQTDRLDKSLKAVWYNQHTDKYHFTDLAKLESYDAKTYSAIISMYKGTEENLINALPGDFATVKDYLPRTIQTQSLFQSRFYDQNLIDDDDNKFTPSDIASLGFVNYYGNSAIKNKIKYQNKDSKTIQSVLSSISDIMPTPDKPIYNVTKKLIYERKGSYSQNTIDIYREQFQLLLRSNAIRILVDGNITRNPASIFTVEIPKDWNDAQFDSPAQYNEWRARFASFAGPYIITELTTIISPMSEIFRQNIRLSRNYLPVTTLI